MAKERHTQAGGPLRFTRSSVAEQAAGALRAAVMAGELADPLPGEHELARRLGISRPSVRVALAQLAAEKLVRVAKGRRTRLIAPQRMPRTAAPTVCVVCPATLQGQPLMEHPLLLQMHALLASRGIHWEEMRDAKLASARPEKRLRELVARRPHLCWILFSAPAPVQRWFASERLPAIVVGSSPPGLELPSVDIDFGAVGRHAAGTILGRGHRRVALIVPENAMPGDAACRAGFLKHVAARQRDGVTVTEVAAPRQSGAFRARVATLLRGDARPTAVLSMRLSNTLAFYVHALEAGRRIPRDVSVVSRDTHPLLEAALPELTRYGASTLKLATRAVRLASHLLAGRRLPAKPSLVTPAFVAGGTLAAR